MKSEKEIRKHRDEVRKIIKACSNCPCSNCVGNMITMVPVDAELTWVLDEDHTGDMDHIVEEISASAAKVVNGKHP